jgi:predicted dehydrogenase
MRIGILGYGSIGSRHGRNLVALGHKVIFHDPAMADTLSVVEVIEKSDAVVIASPTSQHLADIAACKKRKKPCFVEKPIADRIGKDLNWPLMVGYNMRFHPCVIKAKEWLADERVGEPFWGSFICAQYNDKPEYLGMA